VVAAIIDCKKFSVATGAKAIPKVDLELTPINFGAGLTRRLDSSGSPVVFNGYINVTQIGTRSALIYFYLQAGGLSSRDAHANFEIALTKAQRVLSGTSSSSST
jgi:hypothetical protein